MLAVEKWAQGKNPALIFLAVNQALTARAQCEAIRHIKERRIYDHQFPLPDLTSWFAMYHSRKPLLAYNRLIFHSSELADAQVALFGGIRKLNKALKNDPSMVVRVPSPQELEAALAMWQKMCSATFEEIREDIAKVKFSPEMQVKFNNILVRDELPLGFYFLVYVPCLLFYGVSPSALYRKALNREISAIEQLLKLDPLIIHDPTIGFQIQSVRLHGKTNDYDRIVAAISKSPTISYQDMKNERKAIKSDQGALIYVFARASKNPFKIPEIRGLYDALAMDFEGTLQDTDITSPEGFDKTIKTKAAAWQKMHQQPEKQK